MCKHVLREVVSLSIQPAEAAEGVIIPLPPAQSIGPTTHFRAPSVVSSIETLKAGGHFEQYESHLGPHREKILACLAGTWSPVAAAREHYEACDRLDLSDSAYLEMSKRGGGVRKA